MIEKFVKDHFPNEASRISIDNIFSFKNGSRSITKVATCEFANRSTRDYVLSQIKEKNVPCKEIDGNEFRVQNAKTRRQISRNWAVNKAKELLERDSRSQGKSVEIDWKDPAAKNKRSVSANGQQAFVQNEDDFCGRFLEPYSHLFIQ